jgi:hypothetical protein
MCKNFHTVYVSFEEKSDSKDYIGKHSSHDPYDNYMGSFSDKDFNPSQKILLGYATTAEGAVWLEMQWQRSLNVVEDPQYVNQSYQTSVGFDTTGRKRPIHETRPGGLAAAGIPYWTDGKTEKRTLNSPGKNWWRGRLPRSEDTKNRISKTVSEQTWWNNGTEERRLDETPDQTWVEGRLPMSTNNQLWMCLDTGYVTTSGPLTRYQKSRGIDTSHRRKL